MATFQVVKTQCCGIFELSNISALPTAKAVVENASKSIAGWLGEDFSRKPAFLMFSGVVGDRKKIYEDCFHANRSDNYGQALADYIVANGLGTVSEVPPAQNYNGNMLKVWLWAPEWDAIKAIYEATKGPSLSVDPSPITFTYVTLPTGPVSGSGNQ